MQNPAIDSPQFTPLALETRTHVSTKQTAWYLGRVPHTVYCWATYENGPLKPRRVCGRLAWPVADIRRLLGEAA